MRPVRIDPHVLITHWNSVYPPGTEVDLREDDGAVTRTKTRSDAWVLGGHTAVVQVEGKPGCFALDRVTAALEGQTA